MKKIVLSGSASLQDEINDMIDKLKNKYEILDWPKPLNADTFIQAYPNVFKNFMQSITNADVLLAVNADKNGINGYIGAQSYAELCFALTQNIVYGKKIDLYILKMPDKTVHCYNEIKLWLSLGWINIWGK